MILEEGWEDVSGISRFCGEAYSWNGNFSDLYFPISDRAREILGGRDLPYFLNFSVTFFGFLGDFFGFLDEVFLGQKKYLEGGICS